MQTATPAPAKTPHRPHRLELAADALTPVAAALRLGGRCAFLLESVEEGARYGRYSIVGVHGRTLSVRGERATLTGGDTRTFEAADPLEALRDVLAEDGSTAADPAFPIGSGVGYLAYESAARWERLPVPDADPLGLPDAVFHLPSAVIVFDHLAQIARVTSVAPEGGEGRLEEIATLLGTPSAAEVPARFDPVDVPADRDPAGRATYEAGVGRLVEEIHAGEMLQCVLARRFTVATQRTAIEVYRALRRINPSPYLFLLDLSPVAAAGTALVGASPELLVRVREGEVVTRPIAGTRPRADDPAADLALEEELRADPKELAEHAMLVDLARNDVGRVAAAGSVEVASLRTVERYRHVMHLVSEVHGRLRDDLDAFDAVRAVFPAGTLSGAPKVRAMQAIAGLEGERRGPYGGAIGYFSPTDVECAITIRSAVVGEGRATVHAGAGVVADSVPEREAAEVAAKAASMLAAIGPEVAS
jgi:anthranilate synthase component 1